MKKKVVILIALTAVMMLGLLFSVNGHMHRRDLEFRSFKASGLHLNDTLLMIENQLAKILGRHEISLGVKNVPINSPAFTYITIESQLDELYKKVSLIQQENGILKQKLSSRQDLYFPVNELNEQLRSINDSLCRQLILYQETINQLEFQLLLKRQEYQILGLVVDSLNQLHQQTRSNSETVRLISGNKHQLMKAGLIKRQGVLKPLWDEPELKEPTVDLTGVIFKKTTRQFKFSSHRIAIISQHPLTSFEVLHEKSSSVIHIINPERFWQFTNTLIVELK